MADLSRTPAVDGPGGSVWSSARLTRSWPRSTSAPARRTRRRPGRRQARCSLCAWATAACAGRRQFTSGDIFNFFDQSKGRDYDIGASPNLFDINAQRVVGVGDKAGRYELFDALTGKPTWRRQLCPGSHLGGLMTTAAVADGSNWTTCNRLPDKNELAEPTNRSSVMRSMRPPGARDGGGPSREEPRAPSPRPGTRCSCPTPSARSEPLLAEPAACSGKRARRLPDIVSTTPLPAGSRSRPIESSFPTGTRSSRRLTSRPMPSVESWPTESPDGRDERAKWATTRADERCPRSRIATALNSSPMPT